MAARGAMSLALGLLILAGACGKPHKEEGGGGHAGKVEGAFLEAARENKIPARFLIAVGWLESHLVAQRATSNYVTVDSEDAPVERGTPLTDTAFGIGLADLGLDSTEENAFDLPSQIKAYGSWVRRQLDEAGIALTDDPRTTEDHYLWVANFAALHRRQREQRRNVEVIFARELIAILNQGFVWQSSDGLERLELTPERPTIDPGLFPEDGKNWMTLNELRAQIYVASYLPLVTVPTHEFENHPRRIEVIHCPLSLSACLELQSGGKESEVHLAAHYLIPDSKDIFEAAVQVVDHREAVVLTNARGADVAVTDAIVVMLVGNSGRNVGGKRDPAEPTWFNNRQLLLLAQVINDVCTLLAQDNPGEVKLADCISTQGERGVLFRHQNGSEDYRWGDIADFDASIFGAYVKNPGGLAQEVAFDFKKGRKEFQAGTAIALTLLFGTNARTVEIERLSRCNDGRVVWEPQRVDQVRSNRRLTFDTTLFDSGPNRNGDQFFRARVYGQDTKLVGWTIDKVVLQDFEKESAFASERYCTGAVPR